MTVRSNEVLLVPISPHSSHSKLEVTTTHKMRKSSIAPRRLIDDLIFMTSSAGVIVGRIPNDLSDTDLTKWLDCFIGYISSNEQAAWWHTEYAGPWACYVFFPMNKAKKNWIYTNTENDRSRPLKILSVLDTYAEEKPWVLQLHGWDKAELRVAEICGKCYVPTSNPPRQRKRRQDLQSRQKQSPQEGWRSTEIRFVWDPVEQVREVRLRDEEWRDELVLERVEMSLI